MKKIKPQSSEGAKGEEITAETRWGITPAGRGALANRTSEATAAEAEIRRLRKRLKQLTGSPS